MAQIGFYQGGLDGGGLPQTPQQVYLQYIAAGYSPQLATQMSGYNPANYAPPNPTPATTGTSLTAPSATNNPNLTMAQAQQITQQNALPPATGGGGGGGVNPNPAAVQQFQWAQGGGPNPGQLNAAAPDGPLDPVYANMQANVQAAVQRNQNTRPANYSLATNNPGVWIDPSTGGTWSAPGVGSYNSWEVFGTNPAQPRSYYQLPSGAYSADPLSGRVSPVVANTTPQTGPSPIMTTTPPNTGIATPPPMPPPPPAQETTLQMNPPQPWLDQAWTPRGLPNTSAGSNPYTAANGANFDPFAGASFNPQRGYWEGPNMRPSPPGSDGLQPFRPQMQPFNPMFGNGGSPFGGGIEQMLMQMFGGGQPQNPFVSFMQQQSPFGGGNMFPMFGGGMPGMGGGYSGGGNPFMGGGQSPFMTQGNPFSMMGSFPYAPQQQQNPFGSSSMFGNTGFAPTNNNPFAGMGSGMFTQQNPFMNGQQQVPFGMPFAGGGYGGQQSPFGGGGGSPWASPTTFYGGDVGFGGGGFWGPTGGNGQQYPGRNNGMMW